MNKAVRNKKGLAMLAVMFLVALLVPLIYIGTYFRLGNQRETLERSFQDDQLYWTLNAAINKTKFELKNAVGHYGLDNGNGGINPLFTPDSNVTILNGPMDVWLSTFKNNFSNFLTNNNYAHTGSAAVTNVEFVTGSACEKCFAHVETNTVLAATFTLETRVQFPEIMTGAMRQMRQSLYVSTSNLADFSIFYYNNFDTSPGTDTLYQGPIYVGRKANLTPNQGTTLTLSFKESDPGAYALRANQIYWFANRDLGCDPYHPISENVTNCTRDPDTKEFQDGYYEKDVDGKPVFYYYNSNNSPGWVDGNDAGDVVDNPNEKSTIKVKDNNDNNFNGQPNENFTKLISSVNGETPAPTNRKYFFRGDSSLKLMSTAYVETEKTGPDVDGSVVHTTLAFNEIDPLAQFTNPGWQTFINAHFNRNGHMLLEDATAPITLQLGGASNPHELIDPAQEDDSSSLQHVKLQWLARNYNPDKYYGLAIDFRYLFCNCIAYGSANNCSIASTACPIPASDTANPLRQEDPLFWHSSAIDNGFIKFSGYDTFGSFALFPFIGADAWANYFFKDKRTDRTLQIITVDVGKLKDLIENGNADYNDTIFDLGNASTRKEKPFLLYIGLSHPSDIDPSDLSFYQKKYVIRLINARDLPRGGLTIATHGFVQIEGDYNTVDPEEGSVPDAENCEMKPAAILADQVMALSNSWQDWYGNPGSLAPASYIDPSDNMSYSAPTNPTTNGSPYPIEDYQSHPIRCHQSNGNPCTDNDADVEVNTMIITGNVPNRLMPTDEYENLIGGPTEVGVLSTDFNVWKLTNQHLGYGGEWQRANFRIENFRNADGPAGDGGDAYLKGNAIRYENFGSLCAQANEPPQTPQSHAFNTCVNGLAINPMVDPITGSTCTSYNAAYQQAIQNCITIGGGFVNNVQKPACDLGSADFAQCAQDCGVSAHCIVNICATTNPGAVQSCMDNGIPNTPIIGFKNIPVKNISYDPITDVAQLNNQIGTIDSVFFNGACDSCNGNIPLYLKLETDGNLPTTDMENNHIKPYNPANPNDMDTLTKKFLTSGAPDPAMPDSFLRPGTRFAALAPYGRGLSTQLLPHHFFDQGTAGICGCHTNGNTCFEEPATYYTCANDNGTHCGTYCPECDGGVCSSDGEGCTGGATGEICNPNDCAVETYVCPDDCDPGNACSPLAVKTYKPPSSPVVYYSKGGYQRLMFSQCLTYSPLDGCYDPVNYQKSKRQFLYMPAYQPLYNGGFENLIRYAENWKKWNCNCNGGFCDNCSELTDKNSISFLGTAHALWTAQTLVKTDDITPAHWISTTYNAPERNFLYATTLKNDFCKPPGIPSGVTLNVEGQDQQ